MTTTTTAVMMKRTCLRTPVLLSSKGIPTEPEAGVADHRARVAIDRELSDRGISDPGPMSGPGPAASLGGC